MLDSSFDLFLALKKRNLLENLPSWWWENSGTFDVVLGAILTQNTQWKQVEKSLESLRRAHILTDAQDSTANLCSVAGLSPIVLESHIFGFQRQKSARIVSLSQAIVRDFGDFESFQGAVDLDWLLAQKGIGLESAYSILNYACLRAYMVVDKYTYKLLSALGREMPEYEELRAFCECGIRQNLDSIKAQYAKEGLKDISLAQIFARFHGKIVEFSKMKIDAKELGI